MGDLNDPDARTHLPGCAEGWQILSFIRQPCLPPLLTVAVKKCHTMRPVGKVMYGEDMDVNIEKLATMSPSEVFETYMVPAIFAPWTDALLDLTQLQANDRLLDVACGTGIVARTAYQRMGDSGRVVGLDFNAGQLEVARNIETAIEWREGNATDLPFSDEEFNVITCQQGLQFFPDREAAVNEMYRVLAPGGRVAIAVWCPIGTCPGHAAILDALSRHVGEQATKPTEAIFSISDGDKLRDLLESAGLREATVHSYTKLAHFPSPEDFVAIQWRGSNWARSGVQIERDTLEVMQAEDE